MKRFLAYLCLVLGFGLMFNVNAKVELFKKKDPIKIEDVKALGDPKIITNLIRYYLYLNLIHNLNFSIIKNSEGTTNRVKKVATTNPEITVLAKGPQNTKLSPPI